MLDLLIIKHIKLIGKNKFAEAAPNKNLEAFLAYMIFSSLNIKPTSLTKKSQIASLFSKGVNILDIYANFSKIILEQPVLLFLKLIEFNDHSIKLQKSKQLSYRLLHSFFLMKIKFIKIYIKDYLPNRFI